MKIIYLGSDIKFYNHFIEAIAYVYNDEIQVEMDNYIFCDEDELSNLIKKYQADFVLLDFALFDSVFDLAYQIVRRLQTCVGCSVGAVGSEAQFALLERKYFSNHLFFGMKGIDLNGMIFGLLSYSNYDQIRIPAFVRAFYSEPINVRVPVNIDTFHPHSLVCHSGVTVDNRDNLVLEFVDDEHRLKSGQYFILKTNRIGAKDFGNSMSLAIKSTVYTKGKGGKDFVSDLKYEAQDWTVGPKTLDKIREVAVSAGERRKYGEAAISRLLQLIQYNWVLNDGDVNLSKQTLRCFVYDQKGKLAYQDKDIVESDFYIFYERERFLSEISKWKPSLIVINCKNEGCVEIVKEIISRLVGIVDYFPYIALFSTEISPDVIRDEVEYHQIISFPFVFNASVMSKVESMYLDRYAKKVLARGEKRLERYQRKFKDEKLTENHFNDISIIPRSCLVCFTPLDVELLGISEVEIFFRTDCNIDIGTKVSFQFPFMLHVQVVEHSPDSLMSSVPNCLRGIISFIKEDQMMALRRYVNSVIKEQHRLKDGISVQKIIELKNEYFSGII